MEMDSDTDIRVVDDAEKKRQRRRKRFWFGYNAINLPITFGLYIWTIVIAIPVLETCYTIAVVIMILGAVLGLIQQVPEFFRNFISLEPRTARYVNYIFAFILFVRTVWLIIATVVVSKSQCTHIKYAWISIYVNWGIFASTVVIVGILVIVGVRKAIRLRRSTQL